MSKEEKKKAIEDIAEKFTKLGDDEKSYITGYMAGVHEERQKWEKQQKENKTA